MPRKCLENLKLLLMKETRGCNSTNLLKDRIKKKKRSRIEWKRRRLVLPVSVVVALESEMLLKVELEVQQLKKLI